MKEQRKRRRPTIIYELLISQIRSEQHAVRKSSLELGKAIGSGGSDTELMDDSLQSRVYCLEELQHALDWFVEKIIEERRHDH